MVFLLFIHNDGTDSMSMLGLISSKMHQNLKKHLDVASNLGVTMCHPPDLDSDPGDLPSTGRVDGGLKIGLS